jgi:catechol 2,3-dioxygenase-like lactoylglutathione lyase family enzyme
MKFYTDGLGLEPAQLWTSQNGQAVILDMGRGTLELFDPRHADHIDQIETGQPGLSGRLRFALRVPDLQAALDRLLARGVRLVHPPVVTPWGHHNARVEDPDGLQVTLFQVVEDRE